jgi:hypothetical protein
VLRWLVFFDLDHVVHKAKLEIGRVAKPLVNEFSNVDIVLITQHIQHRENEQV